MLSENQPRQQVQEEGQPDTPLYLLTKEFQSMEGNFPGGAASGRVVPEGNNSEEAPPSRPLVCRRRGSGEPLLLWSPSATGDDNGGVMSSGNSSCCCCSVDCDWKYVVDEVV
uniref:Uncharacterized protein n=1 Tax=Entomoneis paludosa TaxID=265537 RepID=A0A7S2Y719_9STRA